MILNQIKEMGNQPESNDDNSKNKKDNESFTSRKRDPPLDLASQDIRTKTGGAYIPPAKLRMMQLNISDKNSEAYQRLAWETLKKSINGLTNKVNVSNIAVIVKELFSVNLIRGRGLLCRSVLRAQQSSPTFTNVYAALIAVANTKFPKIGELLLKRLIVQFRRAFQRNDKSNCINTTRFIAHLVNQNVAHEILALEIMILLLENATNDSVEVAVAFLKECGAKLEEVSRKGAATIYERLRTILHDGDLAKRVQYMIEVMYAIRKDKFKDHPSILPELDLIDENEQFTHMMQMDFDYDTEDRLNVFKFDPEFQINEAKYEEIKKSILDADENDDDDESGSDDDDDDDDDEEDEEAEEAAATTTIIDNTETNLINLRKTIYLTIQSSLDFEECAHKLLKLDIKPQHYSELCNMIVDCCAQQRTYVKFFGLLAQRFCQLNPEYVEPFKEIFKNCYDTIHRFETCKLRNVAKLFSHLLYTDAIPWKVLEHIRLNENDTTSSSRVFIKILFQQLAESMGLVKLNQRIKDPTLDDAFKGLFPRDNPQYTRFAINFFTSIGLGGLTDDLREHLKLMAAQKVPTLRENLLIKTKQEEKSGESGSSSSSSSDSDSDDSSDSSSESGSSSSEASSSESESSSDDGSESEEYEKMQKHSKIQRNEKNSKHERKRNGKYNDYNDDDGVYGKDRKLRYEKRKRRLDDDDDEEEENRHRSTKRNRHHSSDTRIKDNRKNNDDEKERKEKSSRKRHHRHHEKSNDENQDHKRRHRDDHGGDHHHHHHRRRSHHRHREEKSSRNDQGYDEPKRHRKSHKNREKIIDNNNRHQHFSSSSPPPQQQQKISHEDRFNRIKLSLFNQEQF